MNDTNVSVELLQRVCDTLESATRTVDIVSQFPEQIDDKVQSSGKILNVSMTVSFQSMNDSKPEYCLSTIYIGRKSFTKHNGEWKEDCYE